MGIFEIMGESFNKVFKHIGKILGTMFACLLFCVIVCLLLALLSLVPVLGFIAIIVASVYLLPISYGLMKQLVSIVNDEEISYFGFIKDGMAVGNRYITLMFSLFFRKYLLATIIIIAGYFALFYRGLDLLYRSAGDTSTSPEVLGIFAAIVLLTIGLILSLRATLKYGLCIFEFMNNEDSSPKEIIKNCSDNMQGNKMKLFFIGLFFLLITFLLQLLQINDVVKVIVSIFNYLVIIPYENITLYTFYNSIKKKGEPIEELQDEVINYNN